MKVFWRHEPVGGKCRPVSLTTNLAVTVISRIRLPTHIPGDRSTQTASVCYHNLSTIVRPDSKNRRPSIDQ